MDRRVLGALLIAAGAASAILLGRSISDKSIENVVLIPLSATMMTAGLKLLVSR